MRISDWSSDVSSSDLSGDKIRIFFEEEAFDGAGRLRQDKRLSINKIGHAQHDLDPVFSRFSRLPRLAALAGSLGLARPLLLRRSEERRVGKACVIRCRYRWARLH